MVTIFLFNVMKLNEPQKKKSNTNNLYVTLCRNGPNEWNTIHDCFGVLLKFASVAIATLYILNTPHYRQELSAVNICLP